MVSAPPHSVSMHALSTSLGLILFVSSAIAGPPDYATELNRGRKLTVKGQYAAAIAALDKALEARPGDGRALAARGYARLSSVPGAGPLRPVDRTALARATEDFVAAQRVAEKRGDKKLLRAIAYNHKQIVKRLLTGAPGACRMMTAPETGVVYPSWRAAAVALNKPEGVPLELPSPLDESTARQQLCPECTGGPALEVHSNVDRWSISLFQPLPNNRVRVFANLADEWRQYQCSPETEAKLSRVGGLLRIRVGTAPPEIVGMNEKDEECDPDDGHDGPGGFCMRGCAQGTDWTRHVVYLDAASGTALRVEGPVSVHGRTLESPGCAAVLVGPPAKK